MSRLQLVSFCLIAISIALSVVQTYRVSAANVKTAWAEANLAACGSRLSNLIKDLRSDQAIDDLPDSALTTVPPGWLVPDADASR